LRIHTLLWEVYDSRGEFQKAFEYLRKDGVIDKGFGMLCEANSSPDDFVAETFPSGLTSGEKKSRYDLWRQRTFGALALGLATFRAGEPEFEKKLLVAQYFIEHCLKRAGYASNGTRARLHFFLGQVWEVTYDLSRAYAEYSKSFDYCIARANERLRREAVEAEKETERSFAIYCMGKFKLKMSQIDFEQGRLKQAQYNAKEAGLLLHISHDPFLPHMAALLRCRIDRHHKDFYATGWNLVKRIDQCCSGVRQHRPYYLEASMEAIKTCVISGMPR
jgi:hypothetical protein